MEGSSKYYGGDRRLIQRAYITDWQAHAPRQTNEQIEQYLIMCRAIAEIYSDSLLQRSLAFRGGTVLHKLHLAPASRYSEDIDLVQIEPAPIGPIFDRLKQRLSFLDKPKIIQKNRNNTLVFSFDSEVPPIVRLKLKVEINCREHVPVFGVIRMPFQVESPWYTTTADIITYSLEEILGTKIRALYQRRKGRDLFDLWYALTKASPSIPRIVECFIAAIQSNGLRVSRQEFIANMEKKMSDEEFRNDIAGLLRNGIVYNIDAAWQLVSTELISQLPE
jgi:predicted nucleotidyltransferase component of viral defense system